MTLVITAPLADPFSHDSSVYIPLALMGLFFNPIGRVCLVSAPQIYFLRRDCVVRPRGDGWTRFGLGVAGIQRNTQRPPRSPEASSS